ncbi:hypothetical protein SARC_00426 [Sphaeroforma arctica JP610]|uniref:Anaphase-promoting complex subunit 1 N-terminal domain-containing protein n=1 Tax=Sphaeroforma arctica JP610 TaxID=667725 RepID=A0A0L0GEY9_9EUKA|nr:hypothetical protein SARC_00426 [Sphaeroforma arctica JP610]KNC87444.1 hypothetical protein SARC_00426 [Sphaeroforma arctica JP610]|eukprot:XP_014161346.1 hypothetical protein SARC_00426 [Sphaeroforma arctica JP610]
MNMACADVLVDLGVYTPFGRQYIKWHPSCGDVERKERYQLTHMPASGRDDECSDQELYVNDCTVIWSAGGSVKQCYTGECRVREAVWTLMKYETAQIPETTLAVLRTESVDFTALSGRTYTMPLTRSVAHLHPTHPDGFLLELDARERLDTLNDCGLRYGTHPWAPAQPVVLRTPKGGYLKRAACTNRVEYIHTSCVSDDCDMAINALTYGYTLPCVHHCDKSTQYRGLCFATGTPYQVSRLSCLYSEVSNDLVVCYETSKCTLTLWKAQVSGDPIPKKTEEATDFSKASSRELDSSRSYTGAFADDVMNMARVEQADTLVNDRGGLLVMTLQHSISMGTASSAAYANMKNWTIFACHDCVGQPVSLWMIHRPSSSGCVLDLKGGSTPARTIVAIDDATRISFKSTENCLDDEVLGLQDGKLQLHASNGERILQCRTEHILPTSLPSQVARPAIVGLRDGVGNRVTLCLSNNSMLRVAVSECAKSPIVRCLMRLLQVNLPTRQQPLQVQHDTLNNPPIPQTFLRLRRCYLLSYTPAREWDALVRAVYCLINNGDESECTCGPNQLGGADANEKGLQNPVVKPSEPVSAWEYLCKTHKPANTGLGIPTVQDGLVKSSRRPAHEVTHRSSSHQHWQVVERVFKLLDVCAACMSIDVRFVTCVHRLNGLVDDMLAQLINVQSQSYTRVPTHTDTDPERQVHALKQAKIEVQTRLRRIDMLGWLESKVTRMRSTAHARTADYASAENTLLFPDGLLDIESQKLPSVIQTALAVAELYEFIGQNPNSSTTRVISGVSPQQSTDTDVSLRVGAYAPDHSQVHSAKGTQNRSSSRAFSDMGVDPTGDGTFAGPSSDTVSPTVGLSIRDQRQLVQLLTRRSSRLCLDNLSFGVALPLRECLAAVREHSDPDLDPHACRLVGRGDLIQNKAPIQHPLSGLACLPDEESNGSSPNGVWRYCFTEDRRFLDALAMLQSSGTIYVMVPADRSTAEYDANLEKQTVLLAKLEQSLSRSVGRGMALYGSSRPLLTEPLRVPPITTKGQDYQTRATLTLDPSVFPFVAPPDALPTTTGTTTDISGFTAWPEFHNGAAAGLEIAVKDGISNINSAWIAYNKPLTSKKSLPNQNGESDEKSVTENTYAGFLLALGLQGHLSHLSPAALYGFLRGRNTTTSVAIVLGMAATCRGTQDATVTGLLAMFVPALLPARSAELEAPEAVRTSAVLGLGLLYQGTAQRQMCKTLLREIGKGPGSTSNGASSGYDTRSVSNDEIKNAPSYSLACGLALGMCALGMGDSYQSVHALGDLNLPDELRR